MTRRYLLPAAAFALVAMLVTACSTEATRSSTSGSAPPGTDHVTTPAPAANGAATFTPIVASVLAPPIPVPATDGKVHLAYELFLTNFVSQEVSITGITVEAGTKAVLQIGEAELPGQMRVFGRSEPGVVFGPGQSGLVWLDVTVATEADIPESLSHTIRVVPSTPNPPVLPAEIVEDVATTPVSHERPVVVSPPLRGAGWVDGNGCCGVTAHRGAVSPLNGALWAPERFAIDYVQLQEDGRLWTGEKTNVASYAFFGTDILAVAPGKVVAVVDDLPEQVPGANPTGLPIAEYGGNHVVQDIGGGRYAFYAHIQTGGVKVKVGDELTTGQVVGLLGNSGNSDTPHLHFHIMDGPDPLASNGLPFVFDRFTLTGRFTSPEAIDALTTDGGPAQLEPDFTATQEEGVMPLTRDVMTY